MVSGCVGKGVLCRLIKHRMGKKLLIKKFGQESRLINSVRVIELNHKKMVELGSELLSHH